MKKFVVTLIILIAAVFVYLYIKPAEKTETEIVENIKNEEEVLIVEKMQGTLTDVTGGEATGKVVAGYENGKYTLSAKFENLRELESDYFYEGWIVRRGENLDVLSTGKATLQENKFSSDINLTDHDFYVLTLEPDDGDPAPAEHILEGTSGY